ncbi:MAG TPA: DUF4157 domain-containing protein [Kofleriaceae bacterium]|nr:DUF4157 domain-containing protein [Kofleriaceae bacterium]
MPGKRTLTEGLATPRDDVAIGPRSELAASGAAASAPASVPSGAGGGPLPTLQMLFGVQRAAAGAPADDSAAVHAAAARGTATPASPLPHADRLQRAFGRHDISGIQAHTGGDAAASAHAMGASAYATGNHVVLGSSDLHTVAHEAAHVIQQRAGVSLKGGVGDAGDRYEQHADAVADLVVQGKSAEAMLDTMAGGGGAAGGLPVQTKLFIGVRKVQQEEVTPAARRSVETYGAQVISRLEAMVKDDVVRDREFANWPAAAKAVVEILRKEEEDRTAYAKGDGRHDPLLYDTLRALASRWAMPAPEVEAEEAEAPKTAGASRGKAKGKAAAKPPKASPTASSPATGGPSGGPSSSPGTSSPSPSPGATGDSATTSGEPADGGKAGGDKADEAQQALQRLLAVIHRFQASYDAACAPKSDGLFEFNGDQFFVTHENNNYIVPATDKDNLAPPSKPATAAPTKSKAKGKARGKATAEPEPKPASAEPAEAEAIKKVSYTHGETFGAKVLRDTLVQLIMGKDLTCSKYQLAIFLAGLAAEVRRNSVAQVTNMLIVAGLIDSTGEASAKLNVFTVMPMTTGGTDDPDKERDRMLAPPSSAKALAALPPKLVTDRELAMIANLLRGKNSAAVLRDDLDARLKSASSRQELVTALADAVEAEVAAKIKDLLTKQVVAPELDKLCSEKFIEDHVLGHAKSKAATPRELATRRGVDDSTAIDLSAPSDMARFCPEVATFLSGDGKSKLRLTTRSAAGYLVSHLDSKSKQWTHGFAHVTITREDGTADGGEHRLINHFEGQHWVKKLSDEEYGAHKAAAKEAATKAQTAKPSAATGDAGPSAAAASSEQTGKAGASGGSSGKKADAERRRTYDSADGQRHLDAYRTVGEGNCGIHAIAGGVNGDGRYEHGDQMSVRTQIAQRIRAGALQINVASYRAMLIEVLGEIYNRVAQDEEDQLGPDQQLLWAEFRKIGGLVDELDRAYRAEARRARDQRDVRAELVRQMAGFIRKAPQSVPLRGFLVGEFLRSNNPADAAVKLALQGMGGAARAAHVAQLPNLDHVVEENLPGLMARAAGIPTARKLVARHTRYAADNAAAQPIYPAIVDAHAVALRNAYADVVVQNGYFLRQEDMVVLADIEQRGLILYRRHDQHADQYSEVLRHNDGVNPVHVFHTGDHYERSTLRQDG